MVSLTITRNHPFVTYLIFTKGKRGKLNLVNAVLITYETNIKDNDS